MENGLHLQTLWKIEKSENDNTIETVDDSEIPVFENNQTEDDLPF